MPCSTSPVWRIIPLRYRVCDTWHSNCHQYRVGDHNCTSMGGFYTRNLCDVHATQGTWAYMQHREPELTRNTGNLSLHATQGTWTNTQHREPELTCNTGNLSLHATQGTWAYTQHREPELMSTAMLVAVVIQWHTRHHREPKLMRTAMLVTVVIQWHKPGIKNIKGAAEALDYLCTPERKVIPTAQLGKLNTVLHSFISGLISYYSRINFITHNIWQGALNYSYLLLNRNARYCTIILPIIFPIWFQLEFMLSIPELDFNTKSFLLGNIDV